MTELLDDRVRWAEEASIARIVLARPDAGNALDLATAGALLEAAGRISVGSAEGRIRVAILSAEGRAFCVGGDLREFAGAPEPPEQVAEVARVMHDVILLLTRADAPVITVVQGTVAGGGVGLALAGDIVLFARDAKLRLAYTAAGLSPDCGATVLLPGRIGLVRSLDLALTNKPVTGAQLADWGLATEALEQHELSKRGDEIAMSLAAGSLPALAKAKHLMREVETTLLKGQLAWEAETISALVREGEGYEGIQAFLAKRPPAFGE